MARVIANEAAPDVAAKPGSGAKLPSLTRNRSRHTRFVGTMKLLLPLIAVLLITLVVVWPQLKDQPRGVRFASMPVTIQDTGGGQKVVNARFSGMDNKDQPYVVTADTALQSNSDPEHVRLENPKADITLRSGAWVALTAPQGQYRKKGSILALTGGISMYHDDGYELRTEAATIDLDKGTALGTDPVTGEGPFGSLAARGFRVLEQGRRILFTGRSRLILKQTKNGGPK